jgi:hypothetical protein
MTVAPVKPAVKRGASTKPKRPMSTVTLNITGRRPHSAINAEIGIVRAKKRMPKSWMSRNLERL